MVENASSGVEMPTAIHASLSLASNTSIPPHSFPCIAGESGEKASVRPPMQRTIDPYARFPPISSSVFPYQLISSHLHPSSTSIKALKSGSSRLDQENETAESLVRPVPEGQKSLRCTVDCQRRLPR